MRVRTPKAHGHAKDKRTEVLASDRCGCFHCERIFEPSRITHWCSWSDDEETAICPHCGIDAVIGDASGHAITPTFLKAMNRQWF